MSGIEVVAAVAAVVSAFHGGSELVKIIKEKRRKARQSQQEFEEKQLQDSLVLGEQQIGSRYAQDIKELGDVMVVGDTLARDLLLHIAVNMQAEIIKGLQMAVQNPTVVLNLRLLHEATITNRKDTFVTLDELKQRLVFTRQLPRQVQGLSLSQHRASIMAKPSTHSNTFDLSNAVPEDHVPSAVLLGSQKESKQLRSSLARYLQTKRSNSTSTKSSASTPTERPSINYCQAFEEMAKTRKEDRATLMNDIDEINMLYKGLDTGSRAQDQSWNHDQYPPSFQHRRGTLDVFRGDHSTYHNTNDQDQDSFHISSPQTPPLSWAHSSNQDYSMFNQHVFNGPPQHAMFPTPSSYSTYQTQPSHRYSDCSTSSTPYSDISRDRHDSDSSRTSYGSSEPRYSLHSPLMSKPTFASSSPSNVSSPQHSDHYNAYKPYVATEQTHTTPIAPLNLPNRQPSRTSPLTQGPADAPDEFYKQHPDIQHIKMSPNATVTFGTPPELPIPIIEEQGQTDPERPSVLSTSTQGPPSSHSSASGHTMTMGSSSAPWARTISAPVVARIRQPSIASTDSSGSGTFGILPRPVSAIPSSTIKSLKPGQEQMMNGRPCKDNNYWGFCKGSWAVREEPKKGLALRTMPSGMYNTKEMWECKSCNFRGNTYSIAHPSKKNKTETIVDPNIHTSKSGIRYRWIFLAKSHVKKRTPDSTNEECNYGCVVCSVELKVTSIFGNVDTLMFHLYEHASDMSQMTMKQTKCIVGRTAGADEDWDINIPLFGDVSEVE
ncbi:SH3 domain-containing protein [Stagonosporopsis vannaccii]|nr:SH3 domain-containing protein [Stagonosporopsis vannaccii]